MVRTGGGVAKWSDGDWAELDLACNAHEITSSFLL
jgi:hypothetical protein